MCEACAELGGAEALGASGESWLHAAIARVITVAAAQRFTDSSWIGWMTRVQLRCQGDGGQFCVRNVDRALQVGRDSHGTCAPPKYKSRRAMLPGFRIDLLSLRNARARGHHQRPEQTVLLVARARGEEEGIRRPVGGGALAEAERPEAVNGERPSFGGEQRAAVRKLSVAVQGRGVEGMHAPVAEVADEQVVAERPETGGRQREPPRRVEIVPGRDAADQVAVRVESVHEAVTLARHIVVRGPVLQRGGHGNEPAEGLDPEGRGAGGETGVCESARDFDRMVMAVEP